MPKKVNSPEKSNTRNNNQAKKANKKSKNPSGYVNKTLQSLNLRLNQDITPLTPRQKTAFELSENSLSHLILNGCPGTGKTFLALYFAFRALCDSDSDIHNIKIIRSPTSTHDIGFLPGDEDDKMSPFDRGYKDICNELFNRGDAYSVLKQRGLLDFETTSFMRSRTFRNSFIIVDEMQNCTEHELDTLITRLGEGSRIIFCGDYFQSDLVRKNDKEGILTFLDILAEMGEFTEIEFKPTDIVRHPLVRNYIIQKLKKKGQLPVDYQLEKDPEYETVLQMQNAA